MLIYSRMLWEGEPGKSWITDANPERTLAWAFPPLAKAGAAGNTAFVKPLEVGGSHRWGKGGSQGTGKIFLRSSLCFR